MNTAESERPISPARPRGRAASGISPSCGADRRFPLAFRTPPPQPAVQDSVLRRTLKCGHCMRAPAHCFPAILKSERDGHTLIRVLIWGGVDSGCCNDDEAGVGVRRSPSCSAGPVIGLAARHRTNTLLIHFVVRCGRCGARRSGWGKGGSRAAGSPEAHSMCRCGLLDGHLFALSANTALADPAKRCGVASLATRLRLALVEAARSMLLHSGLHKLQHLLSVFIKGHFPERGAIMLICPHERTHYSRP